MVFGACVVATALIAMSFGELKALLAYGRATTIGMERNTMFSRSWEDLVLMGRPAVPLLSYGLRKHPNEWVRARAAIALRRINPVGIRTLLEERLFGDENYIVRYEAAEQLGSLGDSAAVPALLRCITTDPNYYPRCACATSLGELGNPTLSDTIVEALEKEQDSTVRQNLVGALGKLRNPSAVPVLIDLLGNDKSLLVRHTAAYSLGAIGGTNAIPALLKASEEKEALIRDAATWALGQIRKPVSLRQ